jgi:hypothetical protein
VKRSLKDSSEDATAVQVKDAVDDQLRVLLDKESSKEVSKHAVGKWDAASRGMGLND